MDDDLKNEIKTAFENTFFTSTRRELFINFEKKCCFFKKWTLERNAGEHNFDYSYSFSDEDQDTRNLLMENGWYPCFVVTGYNATCSPTSDIFMTKYIKVLKELKK